MDIDPKDETNLQLFCFYLYLRVTESEGDVVIVLLNSNITI